MERQPVDRNASLARLKAAVSNARTSSSAGTRDGTWDDAHDMAQALEGEPLADWLHAILHKIEGDDGNARYWYGRCGKRFEAFSDPATELAALADQLAGDERADDQR